jgi:hypothetical protein
MLRSLARVRVGWSVHEQEMNMSPDCGRVCRYVLASVALSLAVVAAGCGESRYPVDGQVLLKGKPLKGKGGAVVLKPDASKGNKGSVSPVGVLQRDGSFSVLANGEPGAQLGWYKVIVTATEPGANPNEDSRRLLNARYGAEATTPLAIEVVANPSPGRYDLQLSP